MEKTIPKSIPKTDLRIRESSGIDWVYEGDSWFIIKTIKTKQYDKILKKWVIVDTKTEKFPIKDYGYVKKLTVKFLVLRERLSANFKPETAIFEITMKCEVPDTKSFKHYYLKVSSSSFHKRKNRFDFGAVILCDVNGGVSQAVGENDTTFFTRINERKVSTKEAIRLQKSCKILNVFKENFDGILSVCTYFKTIKVTKN